MTSFNTNSVCVPKTPPQVDAPAFLLLNFLEKYLLEMLCLGFKARGWALRGAARVGSVLTPHIKLQESRAPRAEFLADPGEQPDPISKQLLLSPCAPGDFLVKELDQLQ